MHPPDLRGWRDADADQVAELSRRWFAPDPPWSARAAREQLTGDAAAGGANVRIAERDGRVTGLVCWVPAPPWLYLWRVFGDDEPTIATLIDTAVRQGWRPGIDRARLSVGTANPAKHRVVAAGGWERSIDFITVARQPAALEAPPVPGDLALHERDAIDRDALRATYNAAFAEIDNTAPVTPHDLDVMLDGADAWPSATAVLTDAAGTCAAFVIGLRASDHMVIEAIGTHARWRGRGLAGLLLRRLVAVAAAERHQEVRAVIASSNPASLGLHAGAGFTERDRKQMWDLPLPAPV